MNPEHDDWAKLDDDLAAFTDALLEGHPMASESEEDLQGLNDIAKKLHRGIAPDESNPAFRARLQSRLEREWQLTHRRKAWRWPRQRSMRFVALAASLAFVLVAVLLVLNAGDTNQPVQGTAAGSLNAGGVVAIAVLLIVGAVVVWAVRRRR